MISGFSSNESQVLKNSHIKILLLENVNQTAVQLLSSQGYQVSSIQHDFYCLWYLQFC